jgi:DNA-directed RNA polymerase specialized sigma24 family protein
MNMRQPSATYEEVAQADDAGGRGLRAGRRSQVERLLALAEHLAPAEAFLVRQVYEHGLRISDIALQQGVPQSQVRTKLKALVRRMGSPLFVFFAGHRDLIARDAARTADLIICKGVSQRQAARLTGQSLHTVRQHMHTIAALARLT